MRRLLFVLLFLLLFGASEGHGATIIPPATPVAGKTQAQLADAWWSWILTLPVSTNPLADTTGAFAHVNNAGPVFFLAGSAGSGFTSRTFTVPAGTPLFFPLADVVDFELPVALSPTSCLGGADPLSCATDFLQPFVPVTNLIAT